MSKNLVKSIISRLFVFVMCLLSFSCVVLNPVALRSAPAKLCNIEKSYALPSFREMVKSLFGKNTKSEPNTKNPVYVYLGGCPLGFTINCDGVVVVANSNKTASAIKEGDVITKIEGVGISSTEDIFTVLNSELYAGKEVVLTVVRNGKEFTTNVKPIYDELLNVYKLGVWVRDNSAGIGTLTYIRKDNLGFGALGHPVCDIDTGVVLPVFTGNIFKCNIVGCKQGRKGSPGELKGLFLRNGSVLGSLDTNNKFGVYGTFADKQIESFKGTEIEVANRDEVKSGKAQIRCCVEGNEPKLYDIEIVKTYLQQSQENKSMFIRVTDKELLEKTGGIVQGMSGSPIIQNGKFVGAVTHVFVSDPTKGYGVYADWMINN